MSKKIARGIFRFLGMPFLIFQKGYETEHFSGYISNF